MTPIYVPNDVIMVKDINYRDLKVGDDIAYYGENIGHKEMIISHRIVYISEDYNTFKTKVVANDVEDPEIGMDQVYGKVVYKTVFFSFLGKIMNNPVAFFIIFIIVAILFSIEFISSYLVEKDEEE